MAGRNACLDSTLANSMAKFVQLLTFDGLSAPLHKYFKIFPKKRWKRKVAIDEFDYLNIQEA